MEELKLRTLSVLVDNEAGVLSQISRLFSRKGFNVESLAVGTTDQPKISRMTIEVMANDNQTNLMCNQLAKMVPVHSVKLLVPSHSIRRELVLYKVRAKNSDDKNEIIQIANIFRGSIIDVSKETLTLSVIGDEKKTGKPAGSDSANGKSTFASLYGVTVCGEMVHRETERAKTALAVFGDAAFLCDLADYLADREK